MSISGGPQVITPAENMYYSMDKAVNNLEQVIGRLPDTIRNDYVHEQSRTHGDLTELLISKVPPVVTQIVTGLLLKTYVSPFTSLLLPIRQLGPYEALSVQWMEINFDQGLAPQVEVEGLARLYTHNKTKRGAVAVRRGVAVKIESGFYMSPEGREEWRQQIEQLATIVQRTNDYDVMITLLQTPMRDSRHANELGGSFNVYGSRRQNSFMDRLKLEVDWFGIVNKSEDSRGFSNMVTALRTTMKKQGVEPDAMVIPPNMLGYYLGSKPDLWEYSSAGPSNQANRTASEDIGNDNGIRTQTFQGMKLVDTHVSRMAEGEQESPQDLLTVPKQIGEYYPMLTQNSFMDANSFNNYQSRFRSIRIFNEDHGRIVPVRFGDCVKNCLRWKTDDKGNIAGNGDLSDDHGGIDDLFTKPDGADGFEPVEYWAEMQEKNLTEDSVDNVINSVTGKLSPETLASVNDALAKYLVYIDGNLDTPVRDATGKTLKKGNTQAEKDKYAQVLQATLQSLYDEVRNNLLSKLMAGLAADDVAMMDARTLAYIAVEAPDGSITPWSFDNSTYGPRNWGEYLKKKTYAERVVGHLFLTSKPCWKNIDGMDRKDIYVPVDFVLCRPYMTYNVSSAIVMKSGTDTGETVIGDQKFEMTSNISDRTLYGNYFYYGKAIVKKDRNVIVAPSVFIQNYVKGNNTTFISTPQLPKIEDESGLVQDTHSILAFMIPVNDPVAEVNAIDIRGHRENMSLPDGRSVFYSTAPFYSSLLHIDGAGLDDPVTQWQDYDEVSLRPNSICFLGHTETAAGDVIYRNTGHLGPITYDGVQMSRRQGHYAPIHSAQGR